MHARTELAVLAVAALLARCQGRINISNYFRPCNYLEPSAVVSQCLTQAVQEGVLALAGGAPELDLPPLDPYEHREMSFSYAADKVTMKVVMKNVKVLGMKEAKIKQARLNMTVDSFRLEVDAVQGGIDVEGEYRVEGHYNTMPLDSRGFFNVTIRKVKYTWEFDGAPTQRHNITFCGVKQFNMRPDIGDMRFHASNLFPHNPDLEQLANSAANQNWRLMYRELLPFAQKQWSDIGVDLANKLFLKVPCNETFPGRPLPISL